MIEYWDLYDKNFIKLDGYSHIRGRRIPKGYYHLVVNTIVKSGEYFLFMKRDPNKASYPGYYELTAGGSCLKGERPFHAAKRELYEETGIRAKNIERLYFYKSNAAFYMGFIYETNKDKENIRYQEGETVGHRWVRKSDLRDFIDGHKVATKSLRRYLLKFNESI
ncbi:NUDIX hydrolase [Citroniella saccharovorans]|uniref:NUDIX hydrolase n=1 Tax=Citroniella saccharovorans TaxID=2053367 RepID=A0AAW9MVQ5_9FIRM|nr:NUDIX hydrolase [Citroniella saccharovorans]MEB3428640.1 NUDIX hydrolase [Citroniella saccharovorans]